MDKSTLRQGARGLKIALMARGIFGILIERIDLDLNLRESSMTIRGIPSPQPSSREEDP